MKAQSTIEGKEQERVQGINSFYKQDWTKQTQWEKDRNMFFLGYCFALRWVLGKDDDEMCLTQDENKSTKSQGER